MNDFPRSIDELIGSGTAGLGTLLAQGRRLLELERRLHAVLEPELAPEVRVAGFEKGCLLLVTARAGVAMRLRLDAEGLARSLRSAGVPALREIKVRVAPLPAVSAGEKTSRALPGSAVEALERFARDHGYGSLEHLLEDKNP